MQAPDELEYSICAPANVHRSGALQTRIRCDKNVNKNYYLFDFLSASWILSTKKFIRKTEQFSRGE